MNHPLPRLALPARKSLVALGLALSALNAQALTFNLIHNNTINTTALQGFQQAADRWSALFSDDITVNLTIDFNVLGAGILGSASTSVFGVPASDITSALIVDASSVADAIAVATLASKPAAERLLLNRYGDNPNGAGSLTPWLDANGSFNNTTVLVSGANAKALGYTVNALSDASISFNSNFSFDFDPSDGILATAYDFVGVATHEIGHALGFFSRADFTDFQGIGNFTTDEYGLPMSLDLFRYSAESFALSANDLTADTRAKYFSLDGGATNLGLFSTGVSYGDGRQASHWKDNLGLGILDPTGGKGELLSISALDILAFDAIGYDVIPPVNPPPITPVPEPSTYGLLGGALLAGFAGFRRLRRKR